MTVLPLKYQKQKISDIPDNKPVHVEPSALLVDGAGNGYINPNMLASPSEDSKQFDYSRYITVTRTPQGLIVRLPANAIWTLDPDLDANGLEPVFQFLDK
jgi:hypothetical protein